MAGSNLRDMAQATGQGYGNLMQLGQQAFGPVQQQQGIAGQIPNATEAANSYLGNVNQAESGRATWRGAPQHYADANGARHRRHQRTEHHRQSRGAGQQVVDAALAAPAQFQSEIYDRAVRDARPAIAASYSARGLGQSGAAARGEQDSVQRLADDFAQQAVQARIGALNAAANASGSAASQAIGAQQAAIGRGQLGLGYGQLGHDYDTLQGQLYGQQGQLGLQGSQMPGQILQQMQQVAGAPLDAMTQAAQLQMAPLQLAGAGGQVYSQGLNLPLEYQQALYNLTRDPSKSFLNSLAGTQQSSSKADVRGIFGIPKS
jgi:hypothetical protein